MNENIYPNNQRNHNTKTLRFLVNAYVLFGCIGGAVLGFISFGLSGLVIGLIGGFLLGTAARKVVHVN